MSYYELILSNEQEELLKEKFKADIEKKHNEIKQIEKTTKKVQKYSAYFYIKKEPVIEIVNFILDGQNISYNCILNIDNDKCKCIFRLVKDRLNINHLQNEKNCIIYKIDSDLTDQISEILSKYCNYNYTIIFRIKSKDDSGLYYFGNGHPVYCEVFDKSKSKLIVSKSMEEFDKYDLVCG